VVKYVAEARGKGDAARVGDLTATFFWLYTLIGVATVVVTLGLLPFLQPVFRVPEEHLTTARLVFLLIGLRSAQSMPLGLFAGILNGYQKQTLSNISRTFGTLSYAVLAFWALSVEPTLEALAWVSLGTGVAANVISLVMCVAHAKGMSLSPRRFRGSLLREVSSFSLYFFLIQISLLLATRIDTIITNAFLPLTAVALYTVAIRVPEKAGVLCRQLTNTLTPLIAELKGAGEESNIKAVFRKGSMLSVAMAAPMLVGLFLVTPDLLMAWMGEEFGEAGTACRLLLGATMISIVHSNAENVLSMTGHQRFLAFTSIGAQVFNIALTLVLIHPLGINGVALATLVSAALFQGGMILRRTAQVYSIGMVEFYRGTLWPSIPGCALMVAGFLGLRVVLPPDSLLNILLIELVICVLFVPGFLLALGRADREYFLSRLARMVRRGGSKPRAGANP
jgi:O-antigen/teichoic acid export membrane protein